MSKSKYKVGKPIRSISEFDQSECKFFKVFFGSNARTLHRSFLMSWQYRMLLEKINKRTIFEANLMEAEKDDN